MQTVRDAQLRACSHSMSREALHTVVLLDGQMIDYACAQRNCIFALILVFHFVQPQDVESWQIALRISSVVARVAEAREFWLD